MLFEGVSVSVAEAFASHFCYLWQRSERSAAWKQVKTDAISSHILDFGGGTTAFPNHVGVSAHKVLLVITSMRAVLAQCSPTADGAWKVFW